MAIAQLEHVEYSRLSTQHRQYSSSGQTRQGVSRGWPSMGSLEGLGRSGRAPFKPSMNLNPRGCVVGRCWGKSSGPTRGRGKWWEQWKVEISHRHDMHITRHTSHVKQIEGCCVHRVYSSIKKVQAAPRNQPFSQLPLSVTFFNAPLVRFDSSGVE